MRWPLLLLLLAGWMRAPNEDADVVARSELIVVGHLKPGSIYRVSHEHWWEHHAVLVITQSLKGSSTTEVPIIIHYGLDPMARGTNPLFVDIDTLGSHAVEPVLILDTGNSSQSFAPLVPDATKDNVWLLRKLGGEYGREPGTVYGIADPEDLQPLADRDYLALYLAADPEPGVRAFAAKHEDARAERYLAHREIQRAGTDADTLMPYFLAGARWGGHDEVADALVASGVAGDRLLARFPSADPRLRERIFDIWRRSAYKGAVPTLVKLLGDADRYWAAQKLAKGWWNRDVDSKKTQELRDHYSEVFDALNVLAEVHDPKARPAVARILARFEKIVESEQIVEACYAALR